MNVLQIDKLIKKLGEMTTCEDYVKNDGNCFFAPRSNWLKEKIIKRQIMFGRSILWN